MNGWNQHSSIGGSLCVVKCKVHFALWKILQCLNPPKNIAIAGFLGHCFGMTFDDSMDSNMEKHITQMSWQYIQAQTSNSEDDVPFPKVLFMADIRRSPVEVGSLSHYLQWFLYIHSVVVWNF